MDKTDEELMTDYLGGDSGALAAVFERYKRRLLNFALRLTGNRADAEDVVGDAFTMASSRRYQPRPTAKFSTWLYTVAHNLCIEKIRKGKRSVQGSIFGGEEGREPEFPDPAPGPAETAAGRDMAGLVRAAVEKLPLQYREAIFLREYENLEYAQIAEVMGVTLASVKTLIFRGREKLREELLPLIQEGGQDA